MSKFKVGDKVRILKLDDIDEGVFEVGEVVTIIGDAEPVSDGILYDIGEYDWYVYEDQVEKVEDVALKPLLGGFKHMKAPKQHDPIESRIEEMQARLDQLSEEIDLLMKEEQKLSQQMDTLRQAQRIMKEV